MTHQNKKKNYTHQNNKKNYHSILFKQVKKNRGRWTNEKLLKGINEN